MALSRENDMRVGILGSGDVAKALAGGFLRNDWVHAFKLLTRP